MVSDRMTELGATSLIEAIAADRYAGYAYAYPHKTSYRPLDPTVSLADAWADEDTSRLFLYLHLPFCEMRCGFCNLFTASQPNGSLVEQTLAAIRRQSRVVSEALRPDQILQVAIGGGTPTFLERTELELVFGFLTRDWPIGEHVPFSVEVSPGTVDDDKLKVLIDHGTRRISMGVQSFVDRDLKRLGRPQQNAEVIRAIDRIRRSGIEVFNLDLIYGSTGQTESDWITTVKQALTHRPEELFLYPLYIRELTGLGRRGRNPAENRRHLYRIARDRVLSAGYRQISMRMFRRSDVDYGTEHQCQEDGMVGLGPGARSYTTDLHYSTDYAVSGSQVRGIIGDFNRKTDRELATIDYGVRLDADEQRRRYLIRSLLQTDGLDRQAFRLRFGVDVLEALPQVRELITDGYAEQTESRLRLTESGLAHSDVIGPWLYSEPVRRRMELFDLK